VTALEPLLATARQWHRQGNVDAAAQAYREVLAIAPAHVGARHGLAMLSLQRGDAQAAQAQLAEVLELAPDLFEAWVQRGQALQALGALPDALACLERALVLRPLAPLAAYQRALVLHELGRQDEAIAGFDGLIARGEGQPALYFSRGNALRDASRCDEGIAGYERAIALQPGLDEAFRNRGIVKLLRGDFATGWRDYEHRRPRQSAGMPGLADLPEWQGEDPAGKKLLVSDASGLGDTIHFCRYLPLLVARGAEVSFLGHARLHRLLQPFAAKVRLLSERPADAHFDLHCKLLSLPYRFGTDLSTIPGSVPYLAAEPARIAHWAPRIGAQGFRIGICWQGNPGRVIDAGRSIPLSAFAPLLEVPGVRLISLQKNFGLAQLADLPAGRVETLGDDFDAGPDAFIDTAAVMANLDLVITSDTSIAHLAGALAVPAWVALRAVPEWRWLLGRDDSPWYPGMRLFRQPAPGDWPGVFSAMSRALAAHVAMGSRESL